MVAIKLLSLWIQLTVWVKVSCGTTTFEMRTTLCKIRLLNDQDDRVKYGMKSYGRRAR
jgi:hypothetical protein